MARVIWCLRLMVRVGILRGAILFRIRGGCILFDFGMVCCRRYLPFHGLVSAGYYCVGLALNIPPFQLSSCKTIMSCPISAFDKSIYLARSGKNIPVALSAKYQQP